MLGQRRERWTGLDRWASCRLANSFCRRHRASSHAGRRRRWASSRAGRRRRRQASFRAGRCRRRISSRAGRRQSLASSALLARTRTPGEVVFSGRGRVIRCGNRILWASPRAPSDAASSVRCCASRGRVWVPACSKQGHMLWARPSTSGEAASSVGRRALRSGEPASTYSRARLRTTGVAASSGGRVLQASPRTPGEAATSGGVRADAYCVLRARPRTSLQRPRPLCNAAWSWRRRVRRALLRIGAAAGVAAGEQPEARGRAHGGGCVRPGEGGSLCCKPRDVG